uniref:Uncharacterized protein n=1 Tax=Arundo donax TaxID=35708 RepID=A0A0A9G4X7_ARUDO
MNTTWRSKVKSRSQGLCNALGAHQEPVGG